MPAGTPSRLLSNPHWSKPLVLGRRAQPPLLRVGPPTVTGLSAACRGFGPSPSEEGWLALLSQITATELNKPLFLF